MRHAIDEHGALRGYDGRVIYGDDLTVALYGMLIPAVREEVRASMTADWSVSRDISPDDLVDSRGIASATIRLSDCVARCRIELGPDLPAADRVVVDGNEITVRQEVPDTVISTLLGKDAGDVFGHPVMRGIRISHIRQERSPLVLLWNGPVRYVVDGDASLAEPQLACGALA